MAKYIMKVFSDLLSWRVVIFMFCEGGQDVCQEFVCTFAGHRQVFEPKIEERVKETLESLTGRGRRLVFLCGGMGQFDALCAGAVRWLKKKHPEKDIQLCLVIPYFSGKLNADRSFFQSLYDEILMPDGVEYAHYKAAIPKRNRWMVDQADCLISYIIRQYGGAYQTCRYAKKKSIPIINVAKGAPQCLK